MRGDVEAARSRARRVGHRSGLPSSVRKTHANPKQWTMMSRSTFQAHQCAFRGVLEEGRFLGKTRIYCVY